MGHFCAAAVTAAAVGRLDTIRATFYKLRTQPSVIAASASTTSATRSLTPGPTLAPTRADSEAPGPLPGQPDLGRNLWYGQPLDYSHFDNVLLADGSPAGQAPDGRTAPDAGSKPSGPAFGAGAQAQKALTPEQFAGIIVGAVVGCALMAAVVLVRAVQQRRQASAAASDSQRDLLNSPDANVSYPATRSPSAKHSRSRAQSISAAADAAAEGSGKARAQSISAAAAEGGGSPERSASERESQAPLSSDRSDGGQGGEGSDGAVDVTTVTPGVVTRSAAKLRKYCV
jgi:hypothetical protein